MSLFRGTFVYYLVLLIGVGFLGVYFWIILNATILDIMVKLVFFLSGLILMISTFALAAAKTRSGRTILTILSGLVGGSHAYMVIVLFSNDWLYGTLLFFWLLFGLLLACAAFAWLPETD